MNGAARRHGRHPGLILGVARFFHDPRGSMRGVLESRPSEGRLLAYALLAAAVLLAGRIATLMAAARSGTVDLPPHVAAQAASMLFFVPLVYYLLAGLGTALAKALADGAAGATGAPRSSGRRWSRRRSPFSPAWRRWRSTPRRGR